MANRSVQAVRHELNNATRFLKELDDALRVLEDLRYPYAVDNREYLQWWETREKLWAQRATVASLERELRETRQ